MKFQLALVLSFELAISNADSFHPIFQLITHDSHAMSILYSLCPIIVETPSMRCVNCP